MRGTSMAKAESGSVKDIVRSLRPKQWVKNGFVAVPLVFTGNVLRLPLFLKTAGGVLLFCLVASAGYLLNDIADRDFDRTHPRKRHRPIAAGRLGEREAKKAAYFLLATGLLISVFLSPSFFICLAAYAVVTMSYSVKLRSLPILDMVGVAFGFVLRVMAGAFLIEVALSVWSLLTTAFLTLLLAALKRKQEVLFLEDEARAMGTAGLTYRESFLQQCVTIFSVGTMLTYSLYTFLSHSAERKPLLFFTIPFVFYGVLRYLYLVEHARELLDPDEILISDRPLVICLVSWLALCFLIFHF